MNTLIVYAPNVRYLLKFPLFSPFSRFWEIRIIVSKRFRSRYSSSKNDSRSQNSIVRSFLRLCSTLKRRAYLHSTVIGLIFGARLFFSAKKKKKPGRDQFQYDRQHSSRCLKDIWVLREVAKLDVTGKDVWDERSLEEILEL